MTFEELDQMFPNGLDDAEVTGVVIDYGGRTATFQLNLRGNPPDSPERDVYRPALLKARGIYYVSIEPPDSDHLFSPHHGKVIVDGLPEDRQDFPLFQSLKPRLPIGAFCCRFFVHDWNSFIHIAAADAEFSWRENHGSNGVQRDGTKVASG
jgi:hypothetical protein